MLVHTAGLLIETLNSDLLNLNGDMLLFDVDKTVS